MSYPPHLLSDGETVALDVRPHWSALIPSAVPVIVVAVLSVLLAGSGWLHGVLATVVLVAWAVVLGWAGVRVVGWYTTDFVVTNSRIIFRHGVLSRTSIEIPLDRVTNTSVTKSLFERILGNGTLVVESAGRDGQSRFGDIAEADRVQSLIHQLGDRRSQISGVPAVDITSQLERLAALHQAGSLTDEEFAAAKATLVARPTQP